MARIQKRIRAGAGSLLAALALAFLFSWPATAAIKRFTDEQGTLHINNESAESTSDKVTASTPPGRLPTPPGHRPRTRGAFPMPEASPHQPVIPPEPEVAPPEETAAEETATREAEGPASKSLPPHGPAR